MANSLRGPAIVVLAMAVTLSLGILRTFRHDVESRQTARTPSAANTTVVSAADLKSRTDQWGAREAQPGRPAPAFLTRYETIDKKALRSDDELGELHRMLADHANLHSAGDYLVGIEREITFHQTVKRIEIVDFLIEAERWDLNPRRAETVQIMRDFILRRPDLTGLAENSRSALIGDKVELYNALRAADPIIAAEIKRQAQGTSLEKLIDYAESQQDSGLRVPSVPPGSATGAS